MRRHRSAGPIDPTRHQAHHVRRGACGPCLGTYAWALGARDSAQHRPRTFRRDWFGFAKLCLFLLAERKPVGETALVAGMSAFPPGELQNITASGWLPAGRLRTAGAISFSPSRTGKRARLLCTDADDARRLIAWAAAYIDTVNGDANQPQFDAVDEFGTRAPSGLERSVDEAYGLSPA